MCTTHMECTVEDDGLRTTHTHTRTHTQIRDDGYYPRRASSARVKTTRRPNFTKFSVHAICDHDSFLLGQQCSTLYSATEVTTLWRYTNMCIIIIIIIILPVLLMTSCFLMMERMGQNQRRRTFRPVRQVAAPGGEVCRLLLHLV